MHVFCRQSLNKYMYVKLENLVNKYMKLLNFPVSKFTVPFVTYMIFYIEYWFLKMFIIFAFQNRFFRDYLTERRRIEGDDSPITEVELSALYKEARVFSAVSDYFWTVWSILQADISDIEFGYLVSF